jgi:hypothetical protein
MNTGWRPPQVRSPTANSPFRQGALPRLTEHREHCYLYLARTHWIVSLILIYLAGLTVWCAGRLLQHEQRTRALHAQARAAAVSGQPALAPTPCCSFWKSSAVIHAPDCTRHQGTTP